MKASIVIPSRGGRKRLPRLLSALSAQTVMDWEAIVVIDGDIDDSESVVRAYSHLPVRSLVFTSNRGRVSALNAGFDQAVGDVFIRCDDDLEPATDYVAKHVARHADSLNGVVGLYRNRLPDTPYARAYGERADELYRKVAYSLPEEAWHRWAGNTSIRREAWERVGKYDPRYRAYGWEDVDYGYRLVASGIPVVLAPELETPHHVAATTTAVRVNRAFHSGAARQTFRTIHPGVLSDLEASLDATPWNFLVGAVGRHCGQRSLNRMSKLTDALLPLCPKYLARHLIGLLVESASLSGARRTDQVSLNV